MDIHEALEVLISSSSMPLKRETSEEVCEGKFDFSKYYNLTKIIASKLDKVNFLQREEVHSLDFYLNLFIK